MRVVIMCLMLLCSMAQAQQRWQQLPLQEPYDNIDVLLQLSAVQPAPWQWIESEFPNPGFTQVGYWFRMVVPLETNGRQVLWIRNGVYATLDVYLVRDGVVQSHFQGGTFDNRTLFDDVFLLENLLQRPQGSPASHAAAVEIYLRATPAGVLQLPVQLIDEARMLSQKEQQDFSLGVLLGVMGILAAYFGVLYLIVRDRGFLYYVLHTTSVMLLIAFWHGFDRAWWWPSLISPVPTLLLFMSQLMMVCLLTLVLWFLRLQHSEDATARMLRGLRNASLLLALATPALPQLLVIISNVICGALMFAGVSTALVRYGNFREFSVRLFTMGWLAFLPSAALMASYRLGFFELDMTLEVLVNSGWVLELVLQAFALAVRYDVDQRDKLTAQQQAIAARERESAARSQALHHERLARQALDEADQAQRDYSEALEQRVRQRRVELEHIQQELATISVTDALTGLHNRRFFGERFEHEVTRMQLLGSGLSLMLIDVDHFKRINDTHGHLVGDECLKVVAARLKSQLKRPSDVLCRYGGEEFAVLLPDTPLPGALAFANAICDALAAMPVQCEGVTIDVSISVGLLVTDADAARPVDAVPTADQLLHRVDQALYRAKLDGRNCVRVAD